MYIILLSIGGKNGERKEKAIEGSRYSTVIVNAFKHDSFNCACCFFI